MCAWDNIPEWPKSPEFHSFGDWLEIRPGVLQRSCLNSSNLALVQHKYRCQDCKLSWEAFEDFRVSVDLWANTLNLNTTNWVVEGVVLGGGCMCQPCFEKRLGRPLKPSEVLK
jgi:hypothetical protein